jgi:hypothetical protein
MAIKWLYRFFVVIMQTLYNKNALINGRSDPPLGGEDPAKRCTTRTDVSLRST